MNKAVIFLAALLSFSATVIGAQAVSYSASNGDSDLKYVVYLSRHGVRSPTGKNAQYNAYSLAPWPEWDVPPGYLTQHGYQLMKLFGAYDRLQLASEGLLVARGCEDASRVTIYSDSDQRTQETGKAIAAGLFPGCDLPVKSLPEGTNDPIFHLNPTDFTPAESALATAAIAGRIGGDPANVTEAYRTQIAAMDKILATCGTPSTSPQKRVSLFDIPVVLAPGKGDHLAELRGPLNTASSLAENFLLEYTQGMNADQVGWGCVNPANLHTLIDMHTAATDFTLRTPVIAREQASGLLEPILLSMEQAVSNKTVAGAQGKPTDRALFLIGHDTNLTTISGLLGLTWIADGRRDDTPPGSALVFELWKNRISGEYRVRTYFTVQTLEQMRSATELTLKNPPQHVPVFLPSCGGVDLSCSWTSFQQSIHQSIDRARTGIK
jgi:4-phytase/acid phosphatase